MVTYRDRAIQLLETHGEEIKAFVIPEAGQEVDPVSVIAWCRERMAGYKYPRIVEVVNCLPMTATGKILKIELKKFQRRRE